jgi:tRNA(fMet)-specific endonuclease VapC
MLDTNICVYLINNKPQKVLLRFEKEDYGNIVISSITLSELKFGAYNSSNALKNLSAIAKFTIPLEVLSYGESDADIYGKIRASMRKRGKLIGPNDTFIAAHAISMGCILVTNNLNEFKNVSGLKLENWA